VLGSQARVNVLLSEMNVSQFRVGINVMINFARLCQI